MVSLCQALEITTEEPANVFYNDQAVVLTIRYERERFGGGVIDYGVNDVKNRSVHKGRLALPVPSADFTTLTLEGLECGYYTVLVTAKSVSGMLEHTYAKIAVIRRTEVTEPDKSPFGVDAFLSWRFPMTDAPATSEHNAAAAYSRAVELMKRAGVSWVRDRIAWSHVQPEPNSWDYGRYNTAQRIQSDAGLRVLQVFHDCVPWASEMRRGDNEYRKKFPPKNLMTLYDFFLKTANHYEEEVNAWEIWNEFDVPVFFMGTADEYANILRASYLAIKKANPNAVVLFGSVTFATGLIVWGDTSYEDKEGQRYIEKVLENGVGDYFDIFNVHHYGTVGGLAGKIRRCRDLLKRYDCQRSIWLTEAGSTANRKMGESVEEIEREQAEYLVKTYCIALSEGIEKVFYFSFLQFIEHGTSNWGIVQIEDEKWQPKPGYAALATLINTLNDCEFRGVLGATPSRTTALVFESPDRQVVVAWNDLPTTKAFTLPLKEHIVWRQRSIYGTEKSERERGKIDITLSKEPVYLIIEGKDKIPKKAIMENEGWKWKQEIREKGEARKPEKIWVAIDHSPDTPGYSTDIVHGKVTVYSLHERAVKGALVIQARTGTLTKEIMRKRLDIEPSMFTEETFELKLSSEERQSLIYSGDEIVLRAFFDREDAMESSPITQRYITFEEPIETMQPSLLYELGTTSSFVLSFKRKDAEVPSASLTITHIPSTYELLTPPTQAIHFRDDSDMYRSSINLKKVSSSYKQGETLDFDVSVNGMTFHENTVLETRNIYKRKQDIVIDGKDSDWESYPFYYVGGIARAVHGQELYEGPRDASAWFRLCWDKDALYMFIDITDDEILNPFPHKSPWVGDAIELFLNARQGDEFGDPAYDKNVFQLFFIPPDDAREESMFHVWQPDGTIWKEFEYAIRRKSNGSGYYCEAKIDWSFLGRNDGKAGSRLGIELTLDDIDPGDYEHKQIVWRGSANNWRDASLFTPLILSNSAGE